MERSQLKEWQEIDGASKLSSATKVDIVDKSRS